MWDSATLLWTFALGLVSGYAIFNYVISPTQSTRRKMMVSSWSAPSEGNIYCELECDVTKTQQYITKLREETGEHITITHIAIKAVALGIAECPSVNGRILWGNFLPFSTVDIGCLVNIDGGKDLANVKIAKANLLSLCDISRLLKEKAAKLRGGKDEDFQKTTSTLKLLPTALVKIIVPLAGFLGGAIGMNIPFLGVRKFPFGSCLLTSIGMMGIEKAYVPHLPFARVPILVVVGNIRDKPVVEDGQVVVRPILTITATLDHRFIDGAQGGKLAQVIKQFIENPSEHNPSGCNNNNNNNDNKH